MPKLYSARIALSALKKAGFSITGQKGSHIKLAKKVDDRILTVIVPNHKEIARGTMNSILNQAEMSNEEFERLL